MKQHTAKNLFGLLVATTLSLASAAAAELPTVPSFPVPAKPDGKEADIGKPVQVYILMGQSNMVGAGEVGGDDEGSLKHAIKTKGKYPYLLDEAGNTYMNVGEAMGKAMLGLMKN